MDLYKVKLTGMRTNIEGITMGAKEARKYRKAQAKSVVDRLDKIITRLNFKYTPNWLISDLYDIYHTTQCILAERERDIRRHGDK